jgi:hypothetical protein
MLMILVEGRGLISVSLFCKYNSYSQLIGTTKGRKQLRHYEMAQSFIKLGEIT